MVETNGNITMAALFCSGSDGPMTGLTIFMTACVLNSDVGVRPLSDTCLADAH